ncbi:MAG TPA: helix-turn-helix transcriptional regulator [Dehalococcoidales bacterium]|nr:helix-turn-helix transcriptional regulator [Dehalococcoidales bacterium]
MATLKELRKRSYLTQAELSRAANVPRESISRFEKGRKKPGKQTLAALARALRVAPSQIHFQDTPKAGEKTTIQSRKKSDREQLVLFRLILQNGIRDLLAEVPETTLRRYFGTRRMVDFILETLKQSGPPPGR